MLDLFGSVLTCQAYRATAKFPKHAVETLVACSLMQFGEERLKTGSCFRSCCCCCWWAEENATYSSVR